MRVIQVRNVDKFVQSIKSGQSNANKKTVEKIISDVKKNKDKAIKKYERKFSGSNLSTLSVSKKEIDDAYSKVSKDEIKAIKSAKNQLTKTEKTVRKNLRNFVIKTNGTKISKIFYPIKNVGCYIPGGLARYPSTAVMSIVPAKIAGVKRIVVVSPPNKKGEIDPLTLVASDVCGADEIYKTGGAQSIAALAYGTQTIKAVDKIVGPGGIFVTTAKAIVSENVSIDMLAGPTELGIIADNTSNPDLVAMDLISQAEHSKDTFCFVITTSKQLASSVMRSVNRIAKTVQRSEIVKASLGKNGFVAVCKNEPDVINLANQLAPEHLQIMTRTSKKLSQKIVNSGLVLIGSNSPSSASDYLLGSNHILPTSRFGRVRGSLSVLDFVKLGTQIESSKKSLQKISKDLNLLTKAEGLPNHYEAVKYRL